MELQEATSMDVDTLYKVLDTVIISNLLVVINNEDSPGANDELCRETVVSLGVDYSNEKARVNINVPLKIESNGEEEDAYYRIEQERRIAIQAAKTVRRTFDVAVDESADLIPSMDSRAALAAVGSACARGLSAFFFEYKTLKVVQIGNKKVGVLNRTIQLVLMGFVIGRCSYVRLYIPDKPNAVHQPCREPCACCTRLHRCRYALIYEKGYQRFGSCTSATTVKVKGALSTEHLSEEAFNPVLEGNTQHYRRVWDNEDIVVPPHDTNQFFVTTNVIVTPNQVLGHCPENPAIKHARCRPENDTTTCKKGASVRRGHGVMTGRCVKAAHTSDDQHVCEISGWCPVEQDVQVLKNRSGLLAGVRNFTVLIKNYVQFPLFKVHRRNIPDKMDAHHLRSCVHDARKAPLCPIFRIGDMVEAAGSDFDQIAAKGGVIQIMISWDCDLDYDIKHCLPQYSFLRLDDPEATVAPGFNFRYPKYYNETTRSLVKAYGINFVVLVRGEAERTSPIPIAVTLGSGLGLLVVATVLCDFVVLRLDRRKRLYKARKFRFVSKRESINPKTRHPDLSAFSLKRHETPLLKTLSSTCDSGAPDNARPKGDTT
ncbi:P2X purinoceptor 4-like [Haemaphysalis longicornis]